jgi:hypothetical protein
MSLYLIGAIFLESEEFFSKNLQFPDPEQDWASKKWQLMAAVSGRAGSIHEHEYNFHFVFRLTSARIGTNIGHIIFILFLPVAE